MKPAFLKDDALLRDIEAAPVSRDLLHVWWLGQSGYLIAWDGAYALLDPYLSDSLTVKYANTAKPHVRITERVIVPEQLSFARVVTSSHNHTDHLDAATLGPLLTANPAMAVLVSEANRVFAAERLGVPNASLLGITRDAPLEVAPFVFHAVPAAHNEIERDAAAHDRYIGLVIQAGSFTLYHAGDTLRYPEQADLLARWRIDLAMLPINGNDPARGVAGNLDGPEAAQLAHDIGARLVTPGHFDLFEFNTASPDAFEARCAALGQPFATLRCGERLTMRAFVTTN
jgi:L-ascorbate metabolism protein UlaG (beta-lactamase superfamily)